MIVCAALICAITYLTTIRKLPITLIFIIFFLIGLLTASQNIGYPMLAEQNTSSLIGATFILNSVILLGCGAIVQQIFAKAMPQIVQTNATHPPLAATFILPIMMTVPLILSFFIIETGPKASAKSRKIIAHRKKLAMLKIS